MFFNSVSNREILEFNKTLSLMLLSKLSIVQSLDILHVKVKNDYFKKIIRAVLTDIKSGVSLSKSFSKYPAVFPDIYIANLKVAEETGQIAEVLTEYSAYMENMQTLKRKIIQAARYPSLVLLIALGVVIFMVFFLIPVFEGLFFSSKVTLPALTRAIFSISYLIKDNIYLLVFFFSVVIFTLLKMRKKDPLKSFLDGMIVRIPLFSRLYVQNLLARFSLSMGILLKSGITLVDALKISRNITTNSLFKKEIDIIIRRLIKGDSFSSHIQHSVFFDITFSRMLTVGEESAEMEKVFYLISTYYSKDFDFHLDNITSLIEPILILFVGVIVAVILVAMYLPMFELVNNFGL